MRSDDLQLPTIDFGSLNLDSEWDHLSSTIEASSNITPERGTLTSSGQTPQPCTRWRRQAKPFGKMPFRLMDLPVEIRAIIFQHFFGHGTIWVLFSANEHGLLPSTTYDHKVHAHNNRALLSTCKAVYHEAIDVLWDQTSICVDIGPKFEIFGIGRYTSYEKDTTGNRRIDNTNAARVELIKGFETEMFKRMRRCSLNVDSYATGGFHKVSRESITDIIRNLNKAPMLNTTELHFRKGRDHHIEECIDDQILKDFCTLQVRNISMVTFIEEDWSQAREFGWEKCIVPYIRHKSYKALLDILHAQDKTEIRLNDMRAAIMTEWERVRFNYNHPQIPDGWHLCHIGTGCECGGSGRMPARLALSGYQGCV